MENCINMTSMEYLMAVNEIIVELLRKKLDCSRGAGLVVLKCAWKQFNKKYKNATTV